MNVIQVTPGRFHHFDLARQLKRLGVATAIYSGYPRWKLKEHNEVGALSDEQIHTFPPVQASYMAASRFLGHTKLFDMIKPHWGYACLSSLDTYVALHARKVDVYIAQSGCGKRSGPRFQSFGAKYVCDRGSTHIIHQQKVLTDECQLHGIKFKGIQPKLIDRELSEYESADYITVPSQQSKRTFVSHGVQSGKIFVVPYGVDLTRFSCVGHPSSDSFDLIFVGVLSLRKGLPYLFDAFKSVKHPNKRLHVVGSMTAEIENYLIDHPQPVNVIFHGHVHQQKLNELFSKSHALCLPSLEEGLALVQAQAMASGCPVIATKATGSEDLFDHGVEGFILEAAHDVPALTNAMQAICDSPELFGKLRQAALNRVNQIGGWDSYGEGYYNVLNQIVRE